MSGSGSGILAELLTLRNLLSVRRSSGTHRRHSGHTGHLTGRRVESRSRHSSRTGLLRVAHRSSRSRLRVASRSAVVHRRSRHVRRDTGNTSSLLQRRTSENQHRNEKKSDEERTNHLLSSDLVSLRDLSFELRLSNVLALGERDVKRFRSDHLAVELGDGLGRLVGSGEADESESFRYGLVVHHDLARGDLSERLELGLQLLLRDVVVEVLDVEIDSLVLEGRFVLLLLVRSLQLLLSLALSLRSGDEEELSSVVLLVQILERLSSVLVVVVVDESESFRRSSFRVERDDGGGDGSVLVKERFKLLGGDVEGNVLDVKIGVVSSDFVDLGLSFPPGDVNTDKDDLVVEQHSVHSFDGGEGGLSSVVVHESVTVRVSLGIGSDLAREDVSERGESVVESLVVDVLVKVLDEDVSGSSFAESGISLGPHDSTRSELDERVVELLQSSFA